MKDNQFTLDPEQLTELCIAHADDFEVMLYQLLLDDELDNAKLDTFVEDIAKKVIASIDCRKCANCCRKLSVYLEPASPPDLSRISSIHT